VIAVAAVGLGLLIGLSLGALGGGGSVLTVPALVYVVGQDAQIATTSSLFIVGISALVGALGHARSGPVRWGVGVAFGVVGIAASYVGTALNRLVDPDMLLLAFAVVVLAAATGMLVNTAKRADRPATERQLVYAGSKPDGALPAAGDGPRGASSSGAPETSRSGRRRSAAQAGKVLAAALLAGFMTGFFGVGGGFVVVPALVLALRMPMAEAVATSLLIIALNSTSSLVVRAASADFDWSVIVPFTLAAMAGSLAGKKVADRMSGTTLTRAFAALLIAVAVYTATSSIVGLVGG
jgi:uncharacterized protein